MATIGDAAALAYLRASGAKAISTIQIGDGFALHVSARPAADAVAVLWASGRIAPHLARAARSVAGPKPDAARLAEAVHAVAQRPRLTLTTHEVAISGARALSKRLDQVMAQMQTDGMLKRFLV